MAIFGEKYCPRSYEINGHIILDGKKMSKSTGHFMTLRHAINQFGSDVVKMSLSEKERILTLSFNELWNLMWGNVSNNQYLNEEIIQKINERSRL